MMDGQTDFMQQVDPPGSHFADLFGLPSDSTRPFPRTAQPLRDGAAAAGPDVGYPLMSVKHIGRLNPGVDQTAVRDLAALLCRHRQDEAFDGYCDELLARGQPVEHIYLRLFQPAARLLGEMWVEDLCSFVDVTLAMTRLQSGLRRLAPQFQRHARSADGMRTMLFASLRNDQHSFGLSMVAEFFRRSGWSVRCFAPDEADDLVAQLAREDHAVVGFTASRADQVPELAARIRRLRRTGRASLAGILVGGPLFVTHPDYAREIGADATGLDARQGLAEAEGLASAAGDCR